MNAAARRYVQPPQWDDEELERRRREAITDFISARSAEGSARYQAAFKANLARVEELFAATDDLRDFGSGAALAATPELVKVARYLGAPPISGDDLDTLSGVRVASRKRLDADLAAKAAAVILAAVDPERFPWLFENPPRPPTDAERYTALRWTAGLQATSETQMGRRSEASVRQEAAVRTLLTELGFQEVPNRPIDLTGGLEKGEFSREALVVGIKCDVPARLHDGRLLLIECKVSNSAVNSVKRLNREVGGKARDWTRDLGAVAVPAAVLAGVFKLANLQRAQEGGVALFWERDLSPLARFIEDAV